MKNLLNEHEKVRDHYEKYPYPSYPWWLMGRWTNLDSVDLYKWQLEGPIKNAWIVGCGTVAPLMFGRRNPDVCFKATDISAKSLRILRKRLFLQGVRNVELDCADFVNRITQEKFDAIDAYGVLHHLTNPAKGLKILSDQLRVGGVLRLMLYSATARAEIEYFRSKILESGEVNISAIRRSLEGSSLESDPELSTKVGVADALLHPQVSVFSKKSLDEFINTQPTLRVIKEIDQSNHVLYLKKEES